MRKFLLFSGCVLVAIPFVAVACGGDASKPGAGGEATADVIRATERERLKALVEGNLEAASKLHADDFQLITPAGDSLSKEEYLQEIASGRLDYILWELVSPIKVRVHGEAAVIRYQSEIGITGSFGATTRNWHTDLYEKRDGQWQVVWSQATGAS